MKITIELELNQREQEIVQTNSLERVLSTVLKAESRSELLLVQDDVAFLKPLASRIWYAVSANVVGDLSS
jgi:hypothetical protein